MKTWKDVGEKVRSARNPTNLLKCRIWWWLSEYVIYWIRIEWDWTNSNFNWLLLQCKWTSICWFMWWINVDQLWINNSYHVKIIWWGYTVHMVTGDMTKIREREGIIEKFKMHRDKGQGYYKRKWFSQFGHLTKQYLHRDLLINNVKQL